MTPRVVILSAPSGGGKTTITQALLTRRHDVGYSVSATTRTPRRGERDGVAYHFVTRPVFEQMVAAGEFLEWATYADQLYGTLRREVEAVLASGRHVLLDIEIAGARQVRQAYPPPASVSVFIVPPSVDDLLARLRGRRSESPADLERRLERAVQELRSAAEFDHLVVNDDLEVAVREIGTILDGRPPASRTPHETELLSTLEAGVAARAGRLRAKT